MHLVRSAVLYAALALSANAALADSSALEALRQGDMKKLNFAATPKEVPDIAFFDESGAAHHLSEYRGKYVLLNFWATWCNPCRSEMPALDKLEGELGGDHFAVLPIATLRNSVPGVQRFFSESGVTRLPIRIDPKAEFARQMGVMGLPVTLVIDPSGNEIARLIGDADWNSDSAQAIFKALAEGS